MNTNALDFHHLKRSISILEVLEYYGIRLRAVTKNMQRGRCPLPAHSSKESNDSFSVHVALNVWACHSQSCVAARDGRIGGDILDFISVMERCSIREAAEKLTERTTLSPHHPVGVSLEGWHRQKNKPLTFTLKNLNPYHPYIRRRGITEETAATFGIGFYAGHGLMAGRITIPIHDEVGRLVAYAGRAIDGTKPKYRLPSGFVKSAVLFNLHRVATKTVIVVEGFFDCMKVSQAGFHNVIALMGSSLSQEQRKLLNRFADITLFLDGDEAGSRAATDIAKSLTNLHDVRTVSPGASRQPDQLSSTELRKLLG